MGAYDGAEICELIGIYLLYKIRELNIEPSLYRDDGVVITNGTEKENDELRKKLIKICKSNGLDITVECNKHIIDFLDVTLNIKDGSFWPFVKENSNIKYVNTNSNHPPVVLQNIPKGINNRLNTISSSKELFIQHTKPHQEALKKSGYNFNLEFEDIYRNEAESEH